MQYGLNNVWHQGDVITRGILIILVAMSVLSWTVILYKGAQLIRLKRQTRRVERAFWKAGSLQKGEKALTGSIAGNPYRALVVTATEVHGAHEDSSLESAMSPDEWLGRCLRVTFDDSLARLQRGLGLLASIGSTSPFIGLFGTVWGIYHALLAISASGQSSLEQVAGPVGESLVMTAFGLFVAIPAVLGYNAITRGNKTTAHKLVRFMHDLRAYFMKERQTLAHIPVQPAEAAAKPWLYAAAETRGR